LGTDVGDSNSENTAGHSITFHLSSQTPSFLGLEFPSNIPFDRSRSFHCKSTLSQCDEPFQRGV
jgi:hypothetical protein